VVAGRLSSVVTAGSPERETSEATVSANVFPAEGVTDAVVEWIECVAGAARLSSAA
jgi:hypothetical protein